MAERNPIEGILLPGRQRRKVTSINQLTAERKYFPVGVTFSAMIQKGVRRRFNLCKKKAESKFDPAYF